MFASIFSFEIRRWVKSPATYIYFFILLAIGYLLAITAGGAFDSVNVSLNFGGEKVHANSPMVVDMLLGGLNSYIGLIIVTAVVGNAVLKDFTSNTYSLLYTTPVSKFSYLAGRFWGAFLISMLILTGPAIGMMIGFAMPWLDQARIGGFFPASYMSNYLLTVLPNALFGGALFFAVSLIARDIFMIWITLIILFVAVGVSSAFLGNLEKQTMAALLNPFASSAKYMVTKYWSVFDKNTRIIPLTGVFLYNRLIWLGVAIVTWIIGYSYFSFSGSPRNLFRRNKQLPETTSLARVSFQRISFPKANMEFGTSAYLKNLWGLAINECRSLLRNVYFRIIVLFGMVLLFAVAGQIGKIYDTATFPVTSQVVFFLEGTFHLFVVVLTIIFSGELIWRAKELRMNNILDALPVPNWVFYTSKLMAMFFMQIVLVCIILVCGVIIQSFKGYTHYELLLYVEYLFGFILIDYWLLAVLAMFIQIIANNKYIGYFIAALFYIWNSTFASTVAKHNLFVFSSDPGYTYSEMNHFGHAIFPFIIYKVYWGAFAICLALLSALLWPRGSEDKLKWRWKNTRNREARTAWIVVAASAALFLAAGGFIYYNNDVLNTFRTSYESEELSAKYEKKYKKYQDLPQPKITQVKINLDLYPSERGLHVAGSYVLKNKTSTDIQDVLIDLSNDVTVKKLEFSIPSKLSLNDSDVGYRIFRLGAPLHSGDSMMLSFDLEKTVQGFTHYFSGLSTPLYNGTFINNDGFLPHIGYNPDGELSDNNRRKKHGLGYRATSLPIDNVPAKQRNLFVRDADFIDFDATVSTEADQKAIAPGYIQKEWVENGRRYFHYKMDSPILNFFSVLSARYEIRKEVWNGINLEIWYQKGHEYNLDRMFNGMKKALQYYTTHFTPYQHKQVRIVEFPRYATFAQSFPNTIPFSEGIGFIANVSGDDENIDYPFYVTAHEVAHQWFAHQVVGAEVEGSNLLSESLAQYGSIMVLEKEYGEKKIRKFLSYESDQYMYSRSNESEKEKPLALVDPGQAYILYQKGGIVFYGLSKYIGEDSLDHAIRRFIQQYAFKAPPYPTTYDLLRSIRQSTPDSMQYFVTDAFEKIVFYNNGIKAAKLTGNGKPGYGLAVTIESSKTNADSTGAEKAAPMNDYVEVGVYDRKGDQMNLERYKLKQGDNSIHISLTQKPFKIVIDPRHLLFDKKGEDNEKLL